MMTLKSDKTGQAEYDRFLDLMAKLYLKYGDMKLIEQSYKKQLDDNE